MSSPVPDLGQLLNAVDRREQSVGVAGLTSAERVLHHVSCLYFEVDLGDFQGYYYNSAGDYAIEALLALEELGATGAAAVLRKVNSLFPGGAPSSDRVARFEQMSLLGQSLPDVLGAASAEFRQRVGEDIDSLMEAFALEHADSLPAAP